MREIATTPASTKKTKALTVNIKVLNPDAVLPERKTEEAACYDLAVCGEHYLPHQQSTIVPLGYALGIPKGYHAEIYLRSSIGAHSRLRLGNGVGVIDSDYTGELCLIVDNTADYPCRLFHGDRIAQMLIKKDEDVTFKVVKELKDTKRGSGGIGSTGK